MVSRIRSPVARGALVLELGAAQRPQRRERDDRPRHRVRDLGVAAGQRDAGLGGGRGQPSQLREGLRRRRARGQQHRRQQPARLGAGGRDVVDVHEDGGAPHGLAAEGDRVAVGDEQLGAGEVDGGDVFADPRRHEHGRVVAGGAGEEPGQQVVGQLARRQRQAEPDDVLELGEAADDEVAVGRVRLGGLAVARLAVVDEERGDGAGGAARAHVEQEVADDERLLRRHAHGRGRVQHAVRRGLGAMTPSSRVTTTSKSSTVSAAEAAQRALDRAAARCA